MICESCGTKWFARVGLSLALPETWRCGNCGGNLAPLEDRPQAQAQTREPARKDAA